MRAWRLVVGVLALALSWAAARDARACKPRHEKRYISMPFVDTPGLELGPSNSTLSCTAKKRTTTCRFHARHELVNRSDAPWSGRVAIFWDSGATLRVEFSGGASTTAAPVELHERAIGRMLGQPSDVPLESASAELAIASGGRATIEISGVVTPGKFIPACETLQVERRHMLVSRDRGTEHNVILVEDPQLPASRDTHVELRIPRAWGPMGRRKRSRPFLSERTTPLESNGAYLWFERRPPVWPGGPIVAVGVDVRDRPQLKLRMGWEFAFPKLLFWSLAVESDAKSHVELVPTIEVTVPRWHYYLGALPAPSLGLGAPLQVYPDVRGAVRLHVGLHWRVAGLIGFFDAYPAARGRPRQLVGGAAVQFGI